MAEERFQPIRQISAHRRLRLSGIGAGVSS